MTETRTFHSGRALLGFVVTLVAHAAVVAGAAIAGGTTPAGDGWDDLAAVAIVLFLGELAILVLAVIAGIVFMARGRKDIGTGLIAGGLLGPIAFLYVRFGSSPWW